MPELNATPRDPNTPMERPARPEKPPREKAEPSLRKQRRDERREFVRQGREPRKVRVTPANDELRRALRHPRKGGFRSAGSVEWPMDSFTKRRIRDGDVTVEQREQNPKSNGKPARGDAGTGRPSSGSTAA